MVTVNDAEAAWKEYVERGAESIKKPELLSDDKGETIISTIKAFGDTNHTLYKEIIIMVFFFQNLLCLKII